MFRLLEWLGETEGNDTVEQPSHRLLISDGFANVPVKNQYGKSFRFHDAFVSSNRALVINSMYTVCKGSCPQTSDVISELRKVLFPVFGHQLVFLSFTLEPEVDDCNALREYAKTFGASVDASDACDWHFLTSTPADIERLRKSLGFYDLNPKIDSDVTQHGNSLMIGNPIKDRWSSMVASLPMNQLTSTIRRVAGFTFEQRYGISQY